MDPPQLSDLIDVYPEQDDPNIQTIISGRREFAELASSPTEPIPVRGQLYNHQQFIVRFMREMRACLVIAETGTGKSGMYIGLAEYYKHINNYLRQHAEEDSVQQPQIRKTFMIFRSDDLRLEFQKQLVCKFTTDYETEQIKRANSLTAMKAAITREVNKHYDIRTYGAFANELQTISDMVIKEQFHNCLFVVDEVHSIRVSTADGDEDLRRSYTQLHRLFHLAPQCKIMLVTATPLINFTSEIAYLMNLILPMNHQMPLNDDDFYNKQELMFFEPYFRGYISFVRALDTGVITTYIGSLLPNGNIVSAVPMSQMQQQIYNKSIERDGDKGQSFYTDQRNICNFVFPNGSYGSEGFNKYVVTNKDNYSATAELRNAILDETWRMAMSPKFFGIVIPGIFSEHPQLAMIAKYTTSTVEEAKFRSMGASFCYDEHVKGSGIIVLSLCLEAYGFTRFDESASVFSVSESNEPQSAYCNPTDYKNRRIMIPKANRYAIYKGGTPDLKIQQMMDLFNSYENRYGEYIRVFIGSRVAQVAINFANVIKIFIMSPSFNEATDYQAESRGIRTDSQQDIIRDLRDVYVKEGKDLRDLKLDVKVYRCAAFSTNSHVKSADEILLDIAADKDRKIRRILRFMKQCAIDCQVHHARNVRDSDIPGSRQCDYQECNYKCVSKAPDRIDYSSYNINYVDAVVSIISNKIIELFRSINMIYLHELVTHLQFHLDHVTMALFSLISTKAIIINRYGYKCYLIMTGETIYLQRHYPINIESLYASLIYIENVTGVERLSLKAFTSKNAEPEQQKLMQYFYTLDFTQPQSFAVGSDILNKLNLLNKVNLLEQAVVNKYVNNKGVIRDDIIINTYRSFIRTTREPVNEIKQVVIRLSNKTGPGRKSKEPTKMDVSKYFSIINGTGEQVYIHNLLGQKIGLTAYGVTERVNKAAGIIRIYKPSEGKWRDTLAEESLVYNLILRQYISDERDEFRKKGIYGTISTADGAFRIVDVTSESPNAKGKEQRKGKTCNTPPESELLTIFYQVGLTPDVAINYDFTRGSRKNPQIIKRDIVKEFPYPTLEQALFSGFSSARGLAIDRLSKLRSPTPSKNRIGDLEGKLSTFDDNVIRHFYIWYTANLGKSELCSILKQHFYVTGRILTI